MPQPHVAKHYGGRHVAGEPVEAPLARDGGAPAHHQSVRPFNAEETKGQVTITSLLYNIVKIIISLYSAGNLWVSCFRRAQVTIAHTIHKGHYQNNGNSCCRYNSDFKNIFIGNIAQWH